jgi:hypothetical protein
MRSFGTTGKPRRARYREGGVGSSDDGENASTAATEVTKATEKRKRNDPQISPINTD